MVRIEIDVGEVKRGIANLAKAHLWTPLIINRVMRDLGNDISKEMKDQIHEHRYRGILEDSIRSVYIEQTKELTIGPDAKRGGYDAGEILELGTGPIRGVPWSPIKAWAFKRGLGIKQAGAIWHQIKEFGIKAHPFIQQTVNRPGFSGVLEKASDRIGREIAVEVFKGESI